MIPDRIGHRYQLLNPLGAGSMGAVYRAYDRLAGEPVALKRVAAPLGHALADPTLRLALAREFQALAALRHPHIVGVRDYGFDEQRQPYFTMELLADARPLTAAAQWLTLPAKLTLLVQALQALDYIHRRQLLHRDLKPGNVLVVNRQVKVLDFGLAATADQVAPASGTLSYMAPEVLRGEAASSASDLFSLGVLAFELLAGWHPFGDQARTAVPAILNSEPSWEYLDIVPELLAVLQRWLVKTPADRFNEARAIIVALAAATGTEFSVETAATRESFLQAAPLIGREHEVAQLTASLVDLQQGQGGAWLLRGESGVGKSRLLAEARTHALVQGVQVVRGQANDSGGGAYHLWRDPLRWLVLLAEADNAEAAVLQPLVPDVAELLGRSIPAAPALEPKAAQTRLFTTVTALLRRATQRQPLLCLLEDLHWADANSLELLRWLQRHLLDTPASPTPLLLIGSYRPGEAPTLPEQLPGLQLLTLQRLQAAQIATLGEAMLGSSGRLPHLVAFLQRETEGNAFFVVEVLRALAAEAGQLGQIGLMTLPAGIFAGGIQTVIARRLQRITGADHQLLTLAAVAGRRLDLALLAQLAPASDLESWLTLCANRLVLEWLDGYWHFQHDKVREGLLTQLDSVARQQTHQQVGEGIEQLYASQLAPHAADLAYHFGAAGDTARERRYSQLAGEVAAAQFANLAAINYISRALVLTPATEPQAQADLLLAREKVYFLHADRPSQQADLATLAQLAEQIGAASLHAEVALRRATYGEITGAYAVAIAAAQEAIQWARQAANSSQETQAYLRWGVSLWRQGEYERADTILTQASALAQTHNLAAWAAECRNNLGTVGRYRGDYVQARAHYQAAISYFRQAGDRRAEAIALNNLGVVYEHTGDYAAARNHYQASLQIRQEIGDRRGEAVAYNNLGVVAQSTGAYDEAIAHYQQARQIDIAANDRWGEGYVLHNLAFIYSCQGAYHTAQQLGIEALELRRTIKDRDGECETLTLLGMIQLYQGDVATALVNCQQGLAIAKEIEAQPTLGYILTCLGDVLVALGRGDEAHAIYTQAVSLRRTLGEAHRTVESLAHLAQLLYRQRQLALAQGQVEEILTYLQSQRLDGVEEPFLVYLVCYEVLQATHDPRAHALLEAACAQLVERAEGIADPQLRHSFLHRVAAHQRLLAYAQAAGLRLPAVG